MGDGSKFLDASKHLYKRVYISVCLSVLPSFLGILISERFIFLYEIWQIIENMWRGYDFLGFMSGFMLGLVSWVTAATWAPRPWGRETAMSSSKRPKIALSSCVNWNFCYQIAASSAFASLAWVASLAKFMIRDDQDNEWRSSFKSNLEKF